MPTTLFPDQTKFHRKEKELQGYAKTEALRTLTEEAH